MLLPNGIIESSENDKVETILFYRSPLLDYQKSLLEKQGIKYEHIEFSEKVLKSCSKKVETFYMLDVFLSITPRRFLEENSEWYYETVKRIYGNEPSLENIYSYEDAAQDAVPFLYRILSKYSDDIGCSVRTFVANRLRWYISTLKEDKIREKIKEIDLTLHTIEEGRLQDSNNTSDVQE